MTPEEFRAFRATASSTGSPTTARASRRWPVMARTEPGDDQGAAAGDAARHARDLRRHPRRPRAHHRARALALAAPAVLRLLPVQRLARRACSATTSAPASASSGSSWQSSPALTELEEVVTDWMRADGRPVRRLERRHPGHGLDQHAGRAALRARAHHRLTAWPAAGCRPKPQPLVVYASAQSHSSVDKAALLAGFGRDERPRRRRTTTHYAMRPDALAAAIDADLRAGRSALRRRRDDRHARPPPPSIRSTRSRAVAERHGIWLHVDAAMAGSAMILPECRWMWEGDRARRLAGRSTRTSGSARRSTARSTTSATPSTSCA